MKCNDLSWRVPIKEGSYTFVSTQEQNKLICERLKLSEISNLYVEANLMFFRHWCSNDIAFDFTTQNAIVIDAKLNVSLRRYETIDFFPIKIDRNISCLYIRDSLSEEQLDKISMSTGLFADVYYGHQINIEEFIIQELSLMIDEQ